MTLFDYFTIPAFQNNSNMKKDIKDFQKLVYDLWAEDRHKYGSMQFPAREAMEQMKKEGVTNAKELYDEFYQRNKERFHYAGD